MIRGSSVIAIACGAVLCVGLPAASAEDLYKGGSWANLAADTKAAEVGDPLTVLVFESAEVRSSASNVSGRDAGMKAGVSTDLASEYGEISFGGRYSGRGEVRRSGSVVAQISVQVVEVLPNGDLLVEGTQLITVNGDETTIGIRGRVRPIDISRDNTVLSTRIAGAEINYDGTGFVTRSARPGIISWLFGVLGLG